MQTLAQVLYFLLLKRNSSDGPCGRNDRSPLLRLRYPIRTVHLLPGRVRFHAPALLGRSAEVERIEDSIRRIQGVHQVSADSRTGSVLIQYDDGRIEAEILFAALIRLLGLEKELNRTPQSLLRREGWAALQSLNHTVYDLTGGLIDLYSVAGILAGALALNRLVLRHLSLPGLLLSSWAVFNARGRRGV